MEILMKEHQKKAFNIRLRNATPLRYPVTLLLDAPPHMRLCTVVYIYLDWILIFW